MRSISLAVALAAFVFPLGFASGMDEAGKLPTDSAGKPLNFDFETGTLKDWTAEGSAFVGGPVRGDTVQARRSDMKSRHQGEYWIGTFERGGDAAEGVLTSRRFKVTHPYARFLVAGGSRAETRVELVDASSGKVFFRCSGDDTEELKPAAADLRNQIGAEIFIRLVDHDSTGWGHINFDDFRFVDAKPDIPNRPGPPDQFAHEGLSPEAAAAAMTLPAGFKATLFAGEPDIVQPIAMAIDDRGRVWAAEAYSYPRRVPDAEAKDRILIFEDADGDGKFDTRKVFHDKLNLVSGLEVGFGGVWVGAAPHFLFIPDRNGDDVADGPPEILLDGWHAEDTHETLNSFAWGPDGWLYGCHGVFTHSRVGKPGTPDAERVPINAGIWRYHPTRREFEVFAYGTSNPWGVDFDACGQAFETACVIPHLYHMIQGARYERQAGPHFNPYTYDDIKTIADHRHYLGANPHGGNGRSDSAGGGHAHAGAMIYQGDSWPREYRGSLFMNNIHGARINRDVLTRSGSGFTGSHAPDFLLANDRWSQIISLKQSPDGGMYMIDWYDKNQCHHNDVNGHDRTNGRIFKITYGTARSQTQDLARLSSSALAERSLASNEWESRHARRILQERGRDQATAAILRGVLGGKRTEHDRLRALWALFALGEPMDWSRIDPKTEPSEYIRAWTVQLGLERDPRSVPIAKLAESAGSDPSPVVLLYLASAAGRLPIADRRPILAALVGRDLVQGDPNLPLMLWYAAEPLAEADAGMALDLASSARDSRFLEFMARRVGSIGDAKAYELITEKLDASRDPGKLSAILRGLGESLSGRRNIPMPKDWAKVSQRLSGHASPEVRSGVMACGVVFGDPIALKSLRQTLVNAALDENVRRNALAALLNARDPELPSALRSLLKVKPLRAAAIRALASFDDPASAEALLAGYASFDRDEKRDALNTLAARVQSARLLLDAVAAGKAPASDLSADLIRQLRNHRNKGIDDQIAKHWGVARDTSADKARQIADYKRMLASPAKRPVDLMLGRSVFVKTCAQCHVLFGSGGKVGPELTGSNRTDRDYILSNVMDPSALIGKDYQAQVIATSDGRVLTGIIRSEDQNAVTIALANDVVTIAKGDIEERRLSAESMMPIDLWKPLSEHEVRSLTAYLASPSQVPLLATPENASSFFNGKDLSGWIGDPALWRVEAGEIVGKTAGLTKNEFLKSELAARDFRLELEVKLAGDQGNSGIQIRSEALANGEMRGDQADIGPGWWGKLYEENGRGLLWDKSGEAHLKRGDWNRYEVIARGSRIRTYLNGQLCVDLDDPAGADRGIFAFQLHSGGPTEVRFRKIKLEVLDPPAN